MVSSGLEKSCNYIKYHSICNNVRQQETQTGKRHCSGTHTPNDQGTGTRAHSSLCISIGVYCSVYNVCELDTAIIVKFESVDSHNP